MILILICFNLLGEEVYIGKLPPPKTFNWTCEKKRMSYEELFKRKMKNVNSNDSTKNDISATNIRLSNTRITSIVEINRLDGRLLGKDPVH